MVGDVEPGQVGPRVAGRHRTRTAARSHAAPQPRSLSSSIEERADEFSWDPEQAGSAVGGRVKGLALAQSRLDGLTNPDEAWAYVE